MLCFFCRNDAGKVGADIKAVLCGDCVQRATGAPDLTPPQPKLSAEEKAARKLARAERKATKLEKLKSAKRGRGRGWHLKKLFEFEGEYFSMGKSISAAEASKIRKSLAKSEGENPFKVTKPRAKAVKRTRVTR